MYTHTHTHTDRQAFRGSSASEEPAYQYNRHKRHKSDPWARKIPWRRRWQPTLVFLLGKFRRQRSMAGYSPWGYKELDTNEHTHMQTYTHTHKHTWRECLCPIIFLSLSVLESELSLVDAIPLLVLHENWRTLMAPKVFNIHIQLLYYFTISIYG